MNTKSFLGAIIVSALSIATPVHGSSQPTSIIVVPIFLPMETLQSALEASIDSVYRDIKDETHRGEILGVGYQIPYRAQWQLERSPISIVGADNWLDASARVTGGASVRNRGGIVPFQTSVNLSADARLRLRLQLEQSWRLNPEVQLFARLNTATIPVRVPLPTPLTPTDVNIDVRGTLQPEVDRMLNSLVQQFQRDIRANRFLEDAAELAWNDLCKSHPVAAVEAGAPTDLWVVVRPIAFHAAQPLIDALGMTLTLGLEADTKLVTEAQAPECDTLPPLRIDEAEPGLSLIVPAELAYGVLSGVLTQQFVGQSIPVGNGALTLTPVDVRLGSEDASLNVVVEVDVAWRGWWAWWSWLFGPTRASIELSTEPALDADNQVLAFKNSRISGRSNDALNVVGNLALLAQEALVSAFERAGVINLAPEAERAREAAERAAASLDTGGLGGLVVETASVDDVRLQSLEVGPQALKLTIVASGDLKLAIREIPIGR